MSMIDCKGMIVSLLERIDGIREEKVSAGTKYLGMGKKQPYADWIVGYVQGASSD